MPMLLLLYKYATCSVDHRFYRKLLVSTIILWTGIGLGGRYGREEPPLEGCRIDVICFVSVLCEIRVGSTFFPSSTFFPPVDNNNKRLQHSNKFAGCGTTFTLGEIDD